MRIFEKILSFLSVAFVTLHGSTTIVESIQEDVATGASFAANQLHLGQDGGVEFVNLCIHLGERDDLIYPSLLWHYRMGVRHFEISSHGLTANQSKKIGMFFDRVKDICTLNLIEIPGTAGDMFAVPRTSPAFKWHLGLTDRQFLCLQRPLEEILAAASDSTLLFPSCTYSGFDPDAPIDFWPQTDEQLSYRTPITHDAPITLTNVQASDYAKDSNAAYIANFETIESAVPFTADMFKDQLPVMEVIAHSVRHACLRGQEYWGDGTFISPIIQNSLEVSLNAFIEKFGSNNGIRFGKTYIYVPVPKCGWSTITLAQGSYELDRKIKSSAYKDFSRFPNEITERYQYLLSEGHYKFTCVRNPYNRALSAYLEKILETDDSYFKKGLGFEEIGFVSFSNFLKRLKELPIKKVDHHFKPQCCLTMSPIVCYNKTVRLENFNEEFQEVMDHIGIPGKPDDYRWDSHARNASKKLSDFYTPECVELVKEYYNLDFEYFGYDKTPNFALKLS